MKQSDAAQVLGLSGQTTPDEVKRAYRQAAKKYHPDINPAGAEMMKIINEAFETLQDYEGELDNADTAPEQEGSYPEAVNDALNAIIALSGIEIEICGAWVWVGGNTYPHRSMLKEAGFRFASKKKRWYFRPEDWRSTSRGQYSMEDIRSKYGSTQAGSRSRKDLLENESA